MPKRRAATISDRSRSLATAFRSPETAPESLRLHCRVDAPGLLLRFQACPVRDPFGFTLHSRRRFAPAAGNFDAFSPLPFPGPARSAAFRPPLPFRTFPHPSGSKRSAVPLRIGPPSESARSPFAPRCRLKLSLETCGYGSMFAVRYFFGRWESNPRPKIFPQDFLRVQTII
jgi:hypothetical protein